MRSEIGYWVATAMFFAVLPLTRRWPRLRAVLPVLTVLAVAAPAVGGMSTGARGIVNWLSMPSRLLALSAMGLAMAMVFYRTWTRPVFAASLLLVASAIFALGLGDEHFRRVVTEPDHLAIVLTVACLGFGLWIGLRRAALNDTRHERGQPPLEGPPGEVVLTWPNLVYIELIAAIACTAILVVWSILVRAPLEPPADPHHAPNPAKAPWYFVGLQELLVYFDPWLAGVVLPALGIIGLCALPYLDRHPRGNGWYTLKQRPVAVTVLLAGLLLWVFPILVGVFLRGPNWNHYGLFEYWDPAKGMHAPGRNLSGLIWTGLFGTDAPTRQTWGLWAPLIREGPCLLLLAGLLLGAFVTLRATTFRTLGSEMGRKRFAFAAAFVTIMAIVPLKIVLHWWLGLKYILAFKEWSLNI